jgi:hypothetical protein
MRVPWLVALGAVCASSHAAAQIRVDPTGVNVSGQGATTAFITFGGLDGYTAADAMWCGELVDAAPAIGQRCDPATIYGALPARYTWAQPSGTGAFTDIMSLPPSVARRAYDGAVAGQSAEFFYVRRFIARDGRPDQFVKVICRLTGGGARVPLSLVDVRLGFVVDSPVLQVPVGSRLPELSALISYTGTGRLTGRWEVVLPGQDPPTSDDLLTEATLPAERRGTQRRYAEVDRFNVFLPPLGRYTLAGPDPSRLPSGASGIHLILLRIEASDDKEADSNLAAVGAGPGIVHAGGVAGFPMPVLRYVVGAGGSELSPVASSGLEPVLSSPADGDAAPRDRPIELRWSVTPAANYCRVEIEAGGERIHAAFVSSGTTVYIVPPFVREKAAARELRWRVAVLDATGRTIKASEWRRLEVR